MQPQVVKAQGWLIGIRTAGQLDFVKRKSFDADGYPVGLRIQCLIATLLVSVVTGMAASPAQALTIDAADRAAPARVECVRDDAVRELDVIAHTTELVALGGWCSSEEDGRLEGLDRIRIVSSGTIVVGIQPTEWFAVSKPRPVWTIETPADANPRVSLYWPRSAHSPRATADGSGIDLDGDGVADVVLTAKTWSVEIHSGGAGGRFDLRDSPTLATDEVRHELNGSDKKTYEFGSVLLGPRSGPQTTVSGSWGNDRIVLAGGNDDVWGLGGNDVIDGGAGADTIFGGAGADILRGGDGDDAISGSTDAWAGYPRPGSDRVWGGTGADVIKQSDRVWAGAGNDIVFRSPLLIDAGPGNDVLVTGDARRLTCGAGFDRAMLGPAQLVRTQCERPLRDNDDGDEYHSRWRPSAWSADRQLWCAARRDYVSAWERCSSLPAREHIRLVRDRLPIVSGDTVVGQALTTVAPRRGADTAAFEAWERCDSAVRTCAPAAGDGLRYTLTQEDVGTRLRARWRWAAGNVVSSSPTSVVKIPTIGASLPLPHITSFEPEPFVYYRYSTQVWAATDRDQDTHIERRMASPYDEPTPWSDDVPMSNVHLGDPGTTTCVRAVDADGQTDGATRCITRPLTVRAFTSMRGWKVDYGTTMMYEGWHLTQTARGGWARTSPMRASRIRVYIYKCEHCATLEFRWNGRLVSRFSGAGHNPPEQMVELPVAEFSSEETGVLEVRAVGPSDGLYIHAISVERDLSTS